MQSDFESEAALIARLSSAKMNDRLTSLLSQKISQTPADKKLVLARANLHRKTGQLTQARQDFQRYVELLEPSSKLRLPAHSISPLGMTSPAGNELPRVMVIDDFLPPEEMAELLSHGQESEALFRKANVGSTDPNYDPDKRETLVFYPFEKGRDRFERIAKDEFDVLCDGLGVPAFDISKVELKMTNHVDGGFFKTHTDNGTNFGQFGRTITWLYYFSTQPARYTGGDLYLFDSDYAKGEYSPDSFTKVKAVPNRFVAFVSSFYHCVSPMKSTSRDFADGRFAISSHINMKPKASSK